MNQSTFRLNFANDFYAPNIISPMTLSVELATHKNKEYMDISNTCDGEDLSPQISWKGVPEGTKSLILQMEDPDAPFGTFFHWAIYNIKPNESGLPENVSKTGSTPAGHAQGINGMRRPGYLGPCPPGKKPHNYIFTLYATSQEPTLQPNLKKKELKKILDEKTIEKTTTSIKYTRKKNK